ncbi:hypothetical protein [Clostridium sp. DJ247]|uniref:hypothetical protein n=1 Tax=Clostridium sp. DJ247 TaxID=2726188 RepID=UPI001623AF21|nr:hypothetical protein [Clostridium sp. DJ247]MBC2578984.1 hypothetical protein [Clostridium sp. DJ247]
MNSKFVDFCVSQGEKDSIIEGIESMLHTYSYKGGGKQLGNLGVIFGDSLPGQKVKIK